MGFLTGLHEPEASHLDVLAAYLPAERIRPAYEAAVRLRYLWHEFGDLILIVCPRPAFCVSITQTLASVPARVRLAPMSKNPSGGLVRALGPVTAIAVVVGTTIGSGVFKKPQIIAEKVDHFGLIAACCGYSAACSSSSVHWRTPKLRPILFPEAGGNYVFLREAYGRLPGFLWGCVEFLIIRTASIAALATIFAAVAQRRHQRPGGFAEAPGHCRSRSACRALGSSLA